MVRRILCGFALIALCAAVLSCERLPRFEQNQIGELSVAPLAVRDSIPAEYGRLVGVTPDNRYPYVSILWFEKPDGTIVAVGVDGQNNRLSEKVLLIPRR